MVCKNCGSELAENQKVCPKCGVDIEDSDKIKITYDDENEEYVEPPVIMEAHTFIDEESFAKKINESKLKENNDSDLATDFVEEKKKKGILSWLLIIIILLIIGAVCYFLVLPNITTPKSNKAKIEENMFSSEDWTSTEIMIDNNFYRLKDEFNKFISNDWNINDDKYPDGINTTIKPNEITEEINITSSNNYDAKVKIKLKNGTDKEEKLENCYIYSISIDNINSNKPINFTLPGNITVGSTELEIKSIYGQLENSEIIKDEVSNSIIYNYKEDYKHLDLTIYENGGLQAFIYYLEEG